MNNVYFSKDGITSTEGNHYCNIAKELCQAANERLKNVKFFNTFISVVGSNEKQLMSEGNKDIEFILEDLQTVASMNSFCAWVREAIKEKEEQQGIVSKTIIERWAKMNDISIPESPEHPKSPVTITELDVINSWDIEKRNKYLKLEAFAATYGKYIHPDGDYSEARKKAHIALNNPIRKEGTGRDTILYYTKESVPIEDVDNLFMILQNQHRTYEKELNQMKFEIKDSVNKATVSANDKYQEELSIWKIKNNEYNSLVLELTSKFNTWKTNELERISKLKIAIPDALKETFKVIKEICDTSK